MVGSIELLSTRFGEAVSDVVKRTTYGEHVHTLRSFTDGRTSTKIKPPKIIDVFRSETHKSYFFSYMWGYLPSASLFLDAPLSHLPSSLDPPRVSLKFIVKNKIDS